MDDGWDKSAAAWIAGQGEEGDWTRRHVLDPAMLSRIDGRSFARALDVGCGEGRFCRMLSSRNIETVGIDPTQALIDRARQRDPAAIIWPGPRHCPSRTNRSISSSPISA